MLRSVLNQLLASLLPKLFGGTYSVRKKLEFRVSHRPGGRCKFHRQTFVCVECLIQSYQQLYLFVTWSGWTTLECLLCYRNDFVGMYSVRGAAFWTQHDLFCGWTGTCLSHNFCTGPTFATPYCHRSAHDSLQRGRFRAGTVRLRRQLK